MEYNIVTNFKIIQEAKKYKDFVVSLGYSSTKKDGDKRVLNEKDKFAHFYNSRYSATIYGQGYIGDISFYTDHFIKDDVVAIYYNFEEYIFDFDFRISREKGIGSYLGSFFKQIEEGIRKKEVIEPIVQIGNPYKLVVGHAHYNPGSVTFDDIKAYKEAKRLGTI